MKSTTERGYGNAHQQIRARFQRNIDSGASYQCACLRPDCQHHSGQCPTTITTLTPWDLGHTDDRTAWTGPECVPCNRSAGARNSNAGRATLHSTW